MIVQQALALGLIGFVIGATLIVNIKDYFPRRVVLERGARLEPDSVTVTLRRENPKPEPSVLLSEMVDDSTGLVRLGQFGPKSADELRKAIRSLPDCDFPAMHQAFPRPVRSCGKTWRRGASARTRCS